MAVLFLGYGYLKGLRLLDRRITYSAVYSDVGGLKVSDDVIMNGLKVGRITEMSKTQVRDSVDITVKFVVSGEIKLPINSEILISSEVLGSPTLQVVLGNSEETAEPGHTFKGTYRKGITERLEQELQPVTESVTSLVRNVDSFVRRLQFVFDASFEMDVSENMASVEEAITNIRNITRRVDELLERESHDIHVIVSSLKSITQVLAEHREDIGQSMQNLRTITDTLAAGNLAKTLDDLGTTVEELSAVIVKFNDPDNTMGAMFSDRELYDKLTVAVKALDELAVDLKRNPRRYLPPLVQIGGKKYIVPSDTAGN